MKRKQENDSSCIKITGAQQQFSPGTADCYTNDASYLSPTSLSSKLLCLKLLPICDGHSLAKILSYLEFRKFHLKHVILCKHNLCTSHQACAFSIKLYLVFFSSAFDFQVSNFLSLISRETKIQKLSVNSTFIIVYALAYNILRDFAPSKLSATLGQIK